MKRKTLLAIFFTITAFSSVFATPQAPDFLIYNGKTNELFSNPLEDFYSDGKATRPEFRIAPKTVSSGNWRGYVATWEISGQKLYLSGINSWFCGLPKGIKKGCNPVKLKDLFREKVAGGKVFASWFSGELYIPDGKMLRYVHSGYASIFEREIRIKFEEGTLIEERVVDNTKNPLPSDAELIRKELERLSRGKPAGNGSTAAAAASGQGTEKREEIIFSETGWGEIRIGAKRKVIEKVLGTGEHDGRRYDDVYFVEYPQKGIQISYTNKEDSAYAIFFYNKQTYYGNFIPASVKTDKGIGWNSAPDDIIKAYGKPPRDFGDDTGNNAWRRLEYDKIDFLFESGKMIRISLSPEKCTGCKN